MCSVNLHGIGVPCREILAILKEKTNLVSEIFAIENITYDTVRVIVEKKDISPLDKSNLQNTNDENMEDDEDEGFEVE